MFLPPQCADSRTSARRLRMVGDMPHASMPPLLWPMTMGAAKPRSSTHRAAMRLSSIASVIRLEGRTFRGAAVADAENVVPPPVERQAGVAQVVSTGGRKRGAPV